MVVMIVLFMVVVIIVSMVVMIVLFMVVVIIVSMVVMVFVIVMLVVSVSVEGASLAEVQCGKPMTFHERNRLRICRDALNRPLQKCL